MPEPVPLLDEGESHRCSISRGFFSNSDAGGIFSVIDRVLRRFDAFTTLLSVIFSYSIQYKI